MLSHLCRQIDDIVDKAVKELKTNLNKKVDDIQSELKDIKEKTVNHMFSKTKRVFLVATVTDLTFALFS
mgnify:CR=1 FL=1